MLQDRFVGKRWIYWAQLLIFSTLGLFSVTLGILFWTGTMTDANGEKRPDAGAPMTIVGTCMLAVATLAAFNIAGRMRPIIRCFREGIECNLVGATSLDGVALVPGAIRIAWTILSLQGFRSQRVRVAWPDFAGAQVSGLPMAYVLTLRGPLTNAKTGRTTNSIAFKQVTFIDPPDRIAAALNSFAANPSSRQQLESWSG